MNGAIAFDTLPRFARALFALIASSVVAVAGCSKPSPSHPRREDEVVVFAAASLRGAFIEIAGAFRKTHPGVTTTLNFAGTEEIETQLEHGAVADVFASADERHMLALFDAKRVASSTLFAENEPVIVVSEEKTSVIRALRDLPLANRLVIGTKEVPIGEYALRILDNAAPSLGPDFRARVEAKVVSRELNVKQVLAKVVLGEADAGIVYRTDAATARGKVAIVTIPAKLNVVAKYPLAVVIGAPHPNLARDFIAFVLADSGQNILRGAFFLAPPAPASPSNGH